MLKQKLITFVLRLLSKLPLPAIHGLGVGLGWLAVLSNTKYARLMKQNLASSQIASNQESFKRILHQNIAETGKALLETFAIWFKPYEKLNKLYQGCSGWEFVEKALKNKQGIIFLTPHLGCFESTSLYLSLIHI